ncbi:MAG TPA: scyllo-inosose 3-dehydrogenase [bacterium]|nr:scyllo-inosose 3-dehydrogenase [bacterium]
MKGIVLSAEWAPRPGYDVSEFERKTGKAITGSSIWRHPKPALRDVEEPRPGPRDVLIDVKAVGICGSDIHFCETDGEGYMMYPGLTRFPQVIGHEFSGRIVEVGKEVRDLRVGDPVTAEEMLWCGRCFSCRIGVPNHCEYLEELGFTVQGAMTRYIAVEERFVWPITAIVEQRGDGEAAWEAGALVEPTGVSYLAMFVRSQGFKPGGTVVVYGAGPIGLAAIALAEAAGAGRVIAFESLDSRRRLATLAGADEVYDPVALEREGTQPWRVVMDLTGGRGAQMQVEAAGVPTRTVPQMERALAVDGKLVIIGRAAERVPMYLEALQVRGSQLFGSQGHAGHGVFPNVIQLMASGRLDMRKIITHRFPLAQGEEALRQALTRGGGKVMIHGTHV